MGRVTRSRKSMGISPVADNVTKLKQKSIERVSPEDDSSDESSDELIQMAKSVASKMSSKKSTNTRGSTSKSKLKETKTYLGFVIDKKPGDVKKLPNEQAGRGKTYTADPCKSVDDSDSDTYDFSDHEEEPDDSRSNKAKQHNNGIQLASSLDVKVDSNNYVGLDCVKTTNKKESLKKSSDIIMKKSVVTTDFEKKDLVPKYEEGVREMKRQRQKERSKSKGKHWFDMKAPEMTEEMKNDLLVLQWRKALDPKRFYKAPDLKTLPKFFQIGKVVDNPADFYHSRIPKKQRKKTLVDELLADADFRRYNKRKYAEIVDAKAKHSGAYRHMKRLKKKKK